MEMTLRPMTQQERMYSYSQSQQIIGQTGCIGFLQADVDTHGIALHGRWHDHSVQLKTAEFESDYAAALNKLRFGELYGGILRNRMTLSAYCLSHPDSSFGKYTDKYGFRADTEQYAYLMQLDPNPDENNLFIYCYKRDWLDHHLKKAEKGIRFITPDYKEVFRIPDGDQIRIMRSDGTMDDRTCRYIDDYHLEVGTDIFHICQFAEIMNRNGNTVLPLRSSLPKQCYVFVETSNEIGIVKKGESGYYRTNLDFGDRDQNCEIVRESNKKAGLSVSQVEAMKAGSMFGWHTPAADPQNYDENGMPIKPKHKDRGDAR